MLLPPQVLGSPLSPHSHSEMESRLHELTENLIQKQTTLEALGSEKTALKLQLERTEVQSVCGVLTPSPLVSVAVLYCLRVSYWTPEELAHHLPTQQSMDWTLLTVSGRLICRSGG